MSYTRLATREFAYLYLLWQVEILDVAVERRPAHQQHLSTPAQPPFLPTLRLARTTGPSSFSGEQNTSIAL
jgi:hypothetical protein